MKNKSFLYSILIILLFCIFSMLIYTPSPAYSNQIGLMQYVCTAPYTAICHVDHGQKIIIAGVKVPIRLDPIIIE